MLRTAATSAVFLFLLTTTLGVGAASDVDAELRLLEDGRHHDVELSRFPDGQIEVRTTGHDPYLVFECPANTQAGSPMTVLEFEAFSPAEILGLEVFYGPPFQATKRIVAGRIPRSESWMRQSVDLTKKNHTSPLPGSGTLPEFRRLRVDLGQNAGRTLRLRHFRLRSPNQEELRSAQEIAKDRANKQRKQNRREAFFETEHAATIDQVEIDSTSITVTGRCDFPNAKLIEIRPEVSFAEQGRVTSGDFYFVDHPGVSAIEDLPSGDFSVKLSHGHSPPGIPDLARTTSRFAVAIDEGPQGDEVGRWRLISHPRYITRWNGAARSDLPKAGANGFKGMGGIVASHPLEELNELDIRHITINLVLNHVVDTKPHPNWDSMELHNRTYWVNVPRLRSYDKVLRFAHQNDMLVCAIVLLRFESPSGQSGQTETLTGTSNVSLIHPEADRSGHYAMPNLTNAASVQLYEAIFEALARRYLVTGSPNGRIHNWIVHNEVGFGWEWTNMGVQPIGIFVDHYIRSMRLIHNVTRRYDFHSRVFASLTHHWNTPPDPTWRSYNNREILSLLTRSSRIEGDFAWGLAFHPYPENLREPDVWDDRSATDDMDTRRITIKNLQVLERWMETDEARDASGRVRGLLLSEQGFNTPDDSEQSEIIQAAAFVYTWQKLRTLKYVEAFHNHRWIDSANEGGLRLGIRTLPEPGFPFGKKKKAWSVYKSLDTELEENATRFAEAIITADP